jgi:hypothetical protein
MVNRYNGSTMRTFKTQKSWILGKIYQIHQGGFADDIPVAIRDQRIWRLWDMFRRDTSLTIAAGDADNTTLKNYRKWHKANPARVDRVVASQYWGDKKDPAPVNLTRVCEQCSDEYTPNRSDSRYCSTKCRVAAHRGK